MFGGERGFTHETSDIECAGKDVTEILGLGTVGLAEAGGTFQVTTGLVGVAAFSVTETTDAQVPGGRADLEVTSQAEIVVLWVSGLDAGGVAQGTCRVSVRAKGDGGTLFTGPVVGKQVGLGMGHTALTADPLAGLALVVVTVEGKQVAVRTERSALRIVATLQASECVCVADMVADLDRTQSMEVTVDKEQNLVKAFARVAQHL